MDAEEQDPIPPLDAASYIYLTLRELHGLARGAGFAPLAEALQIARSHAGDALAASAQGRGSNDDA